MRTSLRLQVWSVFAVFCLHMQDDPSLPCKCCLYTVLQPYTCRRHPDTLLACCLLLLFILLKGRHSDAGRSISFTVCEVTRPRSHAKYAGSWSTARIVPLCKFLCTTHTSCHSCDRFGARYSINCRHILTSDNFNLVWCAILLDTTWVHILHILGQRDRLLVPTVMQKRNVSSI